MKEEVKRARSKGRKPLTLVTNHLPFLRSAGLINIPAYVKGA